MCIRDRIREAAEGLGPTYVKLAQLISAAEGIFPEPLIAECKKCRDEVRPESWVTVRKTIENELGPIDKIFSFIDPVPIAAASIAQVHIAKIKDNSINREVAIKILRPDIEKLFNEELDALMFLAYMIESLVAKTRRLKLIEVVHLLREITNIEMDLSLIHISEPTRPY